jgi:glycerate kinase
LHKIEHIDVSGLDPRLQKTELVTMCDVDNPLYGENGAAYIYGPQKGAGPELIPLLDEGLARLAGIVRRDLGLALADTPGAGAAGGLGFGLMAFTGAKLMPGVDFLLDASGFDGKARDADLIITGEGKLDHQSAFGKTPAGIARRGKALGIPVAAIGGAIDGSLASLYEAGVSAAEACVCAPMSLADAMEHAGAYLEGATERLMRAVALGMNLRPDKP